MAKTDSIRRTARSVLPFMLELSCDLEDDPQKVMELAVERAVDCAIMMENRIKSQLKHVSKSAKDNDNGAQPKPTPGLTRHKPGL